MSKTDSITVARVRELLNYNQETGVFTWLQTRRANAKIGCVAGSIRNGYVLLSIDKVRYPAHRIAWLYVYEIMPDEIDHINGNKSDNRIVNLRSVDRQENMRNKPMYKSNRSGTVGVCVSERNPNRWRAYISVNKTIVRLGYFANIADAIAARKSAELKYGFHVNHGRSQN